MSNTSDYTITTLSSSIRQWATDEGDSFQVPFLIPTPGPISLRRKGLPYFCGPRTPLDVYADRTAGGVTPTPTPDTVFYTEILNVSNSQGSTPMHVGSLYLDAQTYSTIGAMLGELNFGGVKTVYTEFKNYIDGSSLTTLAAENAGTTHKYATQTNIVVSSAGWYDIYLSGSEALVTSSIKGVYYEL